MVHQNIPRIQELQDQCRLDSCSIKTEKENKEMTNYLRVDHANRKLIMDKTFAKKSSIVGTQEYSKLQECHRDFPEYSIVTRHIKKNPQKESYKGLTYEYMEDYIMTHEPQDIVMKVLNEFAELRLIASCHSKAFRYPIIKKWFLEKYPEIVAFGMQSLQESKIVNLSFEATEEKAAS